MKAKVLIVDDSSLARRTLRRLLEGLGHTVEEANDGPSALERYFLNPPDVVMLDMVMTGMYGLEVLGKMREINPTARVIVASADIQTSTRDQARQAGAAAFVNKPVNPRELELVLNGVLEKGAAWN
jgi:two-component system, chemotaxis family, chemotaxis protein CheY